jgi:hypothetical protein
MTEVLNDPGPRLKCFAGSVVQNEVKVTLTIAHLLIFKPKGKLMKTRCEEDNVLCENTELSSIAVLGVCPARIANDTNPVSSSE